MDELNIDGPMRRIKSPLGDGLELVCGRYPGTSAQWSSGYWAYWHEGEIVAKAQMLRRAWWIRIKRTYPKRKPLSPEAQAKRLPVYSPDQLVGALQDPIHREWPAGLKKEKA